MSSITLGLGPIVIIVLGLFQHQKKHPPTPIEFIIACLLVLAVGYLVLISAAGKSAFKTTSFHYIAYSVMSSLIVCISTSVNVLYNKSLCEHHFSTKEVLAIRFILLVVFSGICVAITEPTAFTISNSTAIQLSLISVSMAIIPLSLVQFSIQYLEPLTIMMFSVLVPTFIFFIQFFDHRLQPTLWSFVGVSGILLLASLGSFIRFKREQNPLKQ